MVSSHSNDSSLNPPFNDLVESSSNTVIDLTMVDEEEPALRTSPDFKSSESSCLLDAEKIDPGRSLAPNGPGSSNSSTISCYLSDTEEERLDGTSRFSSVAGVTSDSAATIGHMGNRSTDSLEVL